MALISHVYEDTFIKKFKCPKHKCNTFPKQISIYLKDKMVYSHLVNYCKKGDSYYFKNPETEKIEGPYNLFNLSLSVLDSKEVGYSIKDIGKIVENE